MIVQRVRLDEIDDVKPIVFASLCIRDAEVKPLRVASGVVVGLEDEVILVFVNLDGSSQIATFESGLEQQSVVVRVLRHVKWRNLSLRSFALLIRRGINRVIDDPVHQVLLIGDSVGFSPQALFENEFLRRVKRLEVKAFFDVVRRIFHVLNRSACLHRNDHVVGIRHSWVGFVLVIRHVLGRVRPAYLCLQVRALLRLQLLYLLFTRLVFILDDLFLGRCSVGCLFLVEMRVFVELVSIVEQVLLTFFYFVVLNLVFWHQSLRGVLLDDVFLLVNLIFDALLELGGLFNLVNLLLCAFHLIKI